MKRFNSPKSVQTVELTTPKNFSDFVSLVWSEIYETEMDAYIILSGNIKTAKNLHKFAHNVLWPGKNIAFCSLLTSVYYYSDRHGFNQQNRGLLLKNYEALVFPRDEIFALVKETHLPQGIYKTSNISSVLGYWAKTRKKDIYYFSPSLCQNDNEDGCLFVGEDYDVAKGVGQWRSDTG
jgi:hypothetical protein